MPQFRAVRSVHAQLGNRALFGALDFVGDISPSSGPLGTGAGASGKGSTFTNILTGVKYVNEGTAASPYWTPMDYNHRGLISWHSDFRDGVGSPVAGTNASTTIPGSGLRVFGTAEPNATGGLTVAQGAGGAVATMFCGTTTGLLIALGVGGATVPFKPSTMGPLVIDCSNVIQITDNDLRRFFMGFVGAAADALVSPVTGSTVTLTNVQTDVAGFIFDVGLTATERIFVTHNKANDTPTLVVTAAGVDTGIDNVLGVAQRFRVEVDALGNVKFFIDKLQVSTFALGLTPATNLSPIIALHSTTAAAKNMSLRQFATWANRV